MHRKIVSLLSCMCGLLFFFFFLFSITIIHDLFFFNQEKQINFILLAMQILPGSKRTTS